MVWPLTLILVLSSVAGLFYYLRVVVALYSAPPERAGPMQMLCRPVALLLIVLAILLLWLGVYPAPLLDLVRTTVSGLN